VSNVSLAPEVSVLWKWCIAARNTIFILLLWPLYGIGQAIIFLPCGFFLLLLLLLLFASPNLSGPRLDVYHTSTRGVALEFRMQVWNVLHVACWKYRMQIIAKNLPPGHPCTTLLGCRFATKAHIDNQKKKFFQQQYLLYVSSQYGELRPATAEIGLVVWGTPANFNGFRFLASLLQRRRSAETNKLCTMFGHLVGCYTIYTFWGALAT